MKSTLRLIPLLMFCSIGLANASIVTANAVSDYAETQGNNGWYYGYYAPSEDIVPGYATGDFQRYTYTNNILNYAGLNGWTANPATTAMLTPVGGADYLHLHPSDSAWSILRYDVTTAGQLSTNFTFGRINTYQDGSINASVFLNGTKIADQSNIHFGQSFESQWASKVKIGDKLDFVIDANGNQNYDGSSLKVNVAIAPVPEPETYALMGMGLLGLMAARRKAKKA